MEITKTERRGEGPGAVGECHLACWSEHSTNNPSAARMQAVRLQHLYGLTYSFAVTVSELVWRVTR